MQGGLFFYQKYHSREAKFSNFYQKYRKEANFSKILNQESQSPPKEVYQAWLRKKHARNAVLYIIFPIVIQTWVLEYILSAEGSLPGMIA